HSDWLNPGVARPFQGRVRGAESPAPQADCGARTDTMRTTAFGAVAAVALSTLVYAAAPAAMSVADAAMAEDKDTVLSLLKQGGDVNAAQGDGMTALHWAAMHGDAALASTLLHAGGNVQATTRLGGYTPLHLASQTGTRAVVDALVGRGADVNGRASSGATAL